MAEQPVMNVKPTVVKDTKNTAKEARITIDIHTYNEILDYLMNKPYREVAILIKHIDQSTKF